MFFLFFYRRFKKPTRKATCIPDTATMCDTPHIEKAETVSRFSLKLSVLPNKRALTNGAVSDGNTASIFPDTVWENLAGRYRNENLSLPITSAASVARKIKNSPFANKLVISGS